MSISHLPTLYRILSALLVMTSPGLHAQTRPLVIDYHIPQAPVTPQIDGVIDDGEWDDALVVHLTNETHPSQNIPAVVATEVRVMENGEHFLVAFIATDPEPHRIRAFYRDRDRSFQDDFVGVVLDTFNDERRAFEFFVNPLGMQMDLINDDVKGDEDDAWNAIWESEGRITDTGFVVEMKIPLKQLRVASGLDVQTWGVDFLRFYPRDVRHRLSNNTWDYSVSCYLCQLKKAQGFPALVQGTNLQLIPTITSQLTESRPRPATDDWTRGDAELEAGADLRWGINEDLILNATINPDFSQVEADDAQLDINNTFTLFFEERREFFLDGAEYFNTFENLVHTRNIQDPDYGLKLTGKNGEHVYAVLAANDQRTAFIVPGNVSSTVATLPDTVSDDLALRYRVDRGRNLTLGSLLTRRTAEDYANTMFNTDMNWRLGDSDRIKAQVMYSDTENPMAVQQDFGLAATQADGAWRLEYNHEGEHFELNLRSFGYGEDFRADLGFVTKANYIEHNINPSYTWRPGATHFFRNLGVWSQASRMEDFDGLELQKSGRVGFWFDGPMQTYMETYVYDGTRWFDGQVFDDDGINVFARIRPWGGAEFRLNLNSGHTVDYANTRQGEVLTLKPGITVQLGRHLQMQLNHNYQQFEVEGARLYTTNLSDLRLTYQFSARSFLRAIVLHSDTDRDASLYRNPIDATSRSLGTQLLYSYRFNAQTRFFVGYGDSAVQNDTLMDMEATGRSVFAKFSYAWQY